MRIVDYGSYEKNLQAEGFHDWLKKENGYTVINDNRMGYFKAKVMIAMREGWKLQGGVAVFKEEREFKYYYQAMVKD